MSKKNNLVVNHNTLSNLNIISHRRSIIASYALGVFAFSFSAHAASPFAHVPLSLDRIEQNRAKSNLMLIIDDSGSMGTTGMETAKTVARNMVTDEDNLSKFRFGIAHLYDPPQYNPPLQFQPQSVVLSKIDDADNSSDPHVTNMVSKINGLYAYTMTPLYGSLTAVYRSMIDDPNVIQYRCQKNYVIAITDGYPNVVDKYGNGLAPVLNPFISTQDVASTDLRQSGTDKEGGSWNDKTWKQQNIRTSVIAFNIDIPEMKTLTTEGQGFYLRADNANQLSEAVSTLLNRFASSPNPVPVSPAISGMEVPGELNALSARIYTDVSNWSSELRFLQFTSTTNTEEKDVTGKLKYTSPTYGLEASRRSTIISTPSDGVQSLDKDRMTTVLNNTSFGFDSSKPANYWQDNFIPWLDGWSSKSDTATGLRDRGTGEERYLGDILGGNILNVGAQSDFILNSGKKTKINEYILLNSNDGMFKIYKRTGNTSSPYELKLNYIAGAAPRESGTKIINTLKERADKNYGLNSANPHLYLGDGGLNQLTSPRGQSIVLSSLGKAGKGVFAINLEGKKETNLSKSVGLSDPTVANWKDSVPLWDSSAKVNSSSADPLPDELGYTVGKPVLSLFAMTRKSDGSAKLTSAEGADVRMAAFISNGYEGPSWKRPTLYVMDILGATMVKDRAANTASSPAYLSPPGSYIREIQIPTTLGGKATGNKGLSSPTVVDLDGDEIADLVYVGDQNGNVYRFDFRDKNNNWKVGMLFKGSDKRPITIAPKIYRQDDSNKVVVLFGTGSELYEHDANMSDADSAKSENMQQMYGVVDDIDVIPGSMVPVLQDDLQNQTITNTVNSEGSTYRETSSNDISSKKGWYLTLTPRERIVREIQVKNGTVYFNTTIIKPAETAPANVICFASEAQGSGWSMHLKAETGAMPKAGDDNAHKKLDSLGRSVPVSGLFIDKMALPDVTFAEPNTNPNTSAAYTHDFYGVRSSSGRSLFGMTHSLTTGTALQEGNNNKMLKCNTKDSGQTSYLLLPNGNDGGDQENIGMVGKKIDENCPSVGGSAVRRISWNVIN